MIRKSKLKLRKTHSKKRNRILTRKHRGGSNQPDLSKLTDEELIAYGNKKDFIRGTPPNNDLEKTLWSDWSNALSIKQVEEETKSASKAQNNLTEQIGNPNRNVAGVLNELANVNNSNGNDSNENDNANDNDNDNDNVNANDNKNKNNPISPMKRVQEIITPKPPVKPQALSPSPSPSPSPNQKPNRDDEEEKKEEKKKKEEEEEEEEEDDVNDDVDEEEEEEEEDEKKDDRETKLNKLITKLKEEQGQISFTFKKLNLETLNKEQQEDFKDSIKTQITKLNKNIKKDDIKIILRSGSIVAEVIFDETVSLNDVEDISNASLKVTINGTDYTSSEPEYSIISRWDFVDETDKKVSKRMDFLDLILYPITDQEIEDGQTIVDGQTFDDITKAEKDLDNATTEVENKENKLKDKRELLKKENENLEKKEKEKEKKENELQPILV